MRKRGRPKHPDILTPREWEVMEELRRGKSNPEIARSMGISRAGAKYHVSEILGKLGLTSRYEAATWRPVRRAWWPAGALAVLAWPFKSLWWGSTAKVAAAAAVAATVVAFAVPDGFGLFVTDPEIGPVPDFSDFSYVTARGPRPPCRESGKGRGRRLVPRLLTYRLYQQPDRGHRLPRRYLHDGPRRDQYR